jgi:hypothetical protein
MMSEITPGLTSEQFALVVDSLRAEISRAVAAEREACKEIVRQFIGGHADTVATDVILEAAADAIRARGTP